jgi:Zn-dependent protease with chaperone function
LERIEGFSVDGVRNWQYIVIDTPIPNAFVSEMLPQRFFVTTGLFQEFVTNDDELAMILGHEISHLIKGHNSKRNIVEFLFRGLEITLLMLDPTEGMLSLMVASFLGSSREALVAAHSRSNETEADELGCRLAAMACFNTSRGAKVFQRMAQYDESNGGSRKDLMASHPASAGRYEYVRELAMEEKYEKYSYCQTLTKRVRRALTMASSE